MAGKPRRRAAWRTSRSGSASAGFAASSSDFWSVGCRILRQWSTFANCFHQPVTLLFKSMKEEEKKGEERGWENSIALIEAGWNQNARLRLT